MIARVILFPYTSGGSNRNGPCRAADMACPRSSIADADKDRVNLRPGDDAVTSGKNPLPPPPLLPKLVMLVVLLALFVLVIPPLDFGLASKDGARLNRAVRGLGTEDGIDAMYSESSKPSPIADADTLRPRMVPPDIVLPPPPPLPPIPDFADPPRVYPLFDLLVVAD